MPMLAVTYDQRVALEEAAEAMINDGEEPRASAIRVVPKGQRWRVAGSWLINDALAASKGKPDAQ